MNLRLTVLIFISCCIYTLSQAEGTKQLRPLESDFGYINLMDQQNNLGTERTFALYNATDDTRLNIRIENPNDEIIYFGLKTLSTADLFFRIKDPNGNIIFIETLVPQTDGDIGKIIDYNEAVTGPAPLTPGGYQPFVINPVPGLAGDYSVEFYDPAHNPTTFYAKRKIELFDITVANKSTNTAIDGRLWSKAWDITTTALNNPFNGSTYIYTTDGITTEAKFNQFEAWSFIIQSNSTGPGNSGDVETNRQSIDGGVLAPEYKIFLNKPDTNVFPISQQPEIIGSPNIDLCSPSPSYCIDIETSNPGVIEYIIDLGGAVGFDDVRDRKLISDVPGGEFCLPWDGLDGQGLPLTTNDTFDIILNYQAGITHLFIHDAENNPSGFNVNHVYPDNGLGDPKLYFDDSQSSVGGSTELIGCESNCHTWSSNFGNNKTINTWWVTFFENDTIFNIHINKPINNATVAILENQAVDCAGDALQLSPTGITNGGITPTFTWWLNGVQEATSNNYSPNNLKNGDSISVIITPSDICSFADTASYTVSLPKFSISAKDTTICQRDSATINLVSTSPNTPLTYAWTPAIGLGNTNSSTVKVSPSDTTVYEIISTDSKGCKDTTNNTINVLSKPNLIVAGNDTCTGANSLLSSTVSNGNGSFTYAWSPATSLSTPTAASTQAKPLTTTTYQLIVTDALTCKDTSTVTVTMHDKPTVTIDGNDFCALDSTLLSATVSGGTGTMAYAWSPTLNLATPTTATTKASPAINTDYQLIITDINGCKDTATTSITVLSKPNLSVSGNDTCRGSSSQLNSTVSNGNGSFTYAWSPTTGLSTPTAASTLASPFINTSYQLIVTDALGCKDTATTLITIHDKPTVAISGNDFCALDSTLLSSTVSGGTGTMTYAWSPTLNLATPATATTKASPAVNTTYQLIITDINGCKDTATTSIAVLNKPVVNILGNAICKGDTTSLTSTVTNSTGSLTYAWTPTINLTTASAASTLANPSINTTYTLIVKDGNNCKDTASTLIIVNDKPEVSVSGNDVCAGSSTRLNSSVSGGTGTMGYDWQPAINLSSSNTATTFAKPTVNTTYELILTDVNGCKDTASTLISINPKPIVSISGNDICAGNTSLLSSSVSNGTGSMMYSWSPSTNLSSANSASTQASPLVDTNFKLIITDSKGCKDTASTFITVFSKPVVSIQGNNVCAGSSTLLNSSINNENGTVSYKWSPSSTLSTTTSANTTASPTSITNYELIVTDSENCKDTANISIDVATLPIADIIQDDLLLCPEETALLESYEDPTEDYTYTWLYSTDSLNYHSITYTKSTEQFETGYYQVEVKNKGVCPVMSTPIFIEKENLEIEANSNVDSLFIEELVLLDAQASENVTSISWDIDGQVITQTNIEHALEKDTWFTVIGRGVKCEVRDSIHVTALYPIIPPPPIIIPNGFSPNGDQKNDAWFIKGLASYDKVNVTIFNRWGSIVYEYTNQYDQPWLGINQNGEDLPDATYYYVITSNGEHKFNYKGNVTILR